jgi:hypothetical protein
MSTQLPDSIATFFKVSNGSDVSELSQCFAEDALVRDEGRLHRGHEAIEAWLRDARRKYAYRVEPVNAVRQGSIVKVRAKVEGDFPGSPVELEHVFRLAGNRIESLEIHG